MEDKLKLYDEVELLVDLIENVDSQSNSKQNIKKGSIGTIIEFLDENNLLVEFSYKIYSDPITSVSIDKVKKIVKN